MKELPIHQHPNFQKIRKEYGLEKTKARRERFRFWYGFPTFSLLVPGFEVIAADDEFLRVKQGEKQFYPEESPSSWRLSPVLPNGNAAMDRCIRIPKIPCRFKRGVLDKIQAIAAKFGVAREDAEVTIRSQAEELNMDYDELVNIQYATAIGMSGKEET